MEREKSTVLLVEDEEVARVFTVGGLERAGYQVGSVKNGKDAMIALTGIRPDIILLDLCLPDGNGLDFLPEMAAHSPDSALIILTGISDVEAATEALRSGASDFVTKPFDMGNLVHRMEEARSRKDRARDERKRMADLETLVADRTQALEQAIARLRRGYDQTILALGATLDLRDTETERHCVRVSELSVRIARAAGHRDERELRDLRWGAILHDIGKIGIPDSILLKPGDLAESEREIIKRHPALGHRMLSRVSFLKDAAEVVLYHHERYDGKGYPCGLSGEAIPFAARVFAIADTFDAMTSDRPYRKAMEIDEAKREILRLSGSQFDPVMAEAFSSLSTEDIARHAEGGGMEADEPGSKARPVSAGPVSGKRVLFVDDEETTVELGEMSLERLGCAVVGRTDPETALELFKASPGSYDVVVTDQIMPRLMGRDLALSMRMIRSDIPIVIATGAQGSYTPEMAERDGFSFISKPYTLEQLGKAVSQGA